MSTEGKKFLTIKDAATIIGVTELTLRNWDKGGKFVAGRHPINNYRVYTLDQVEELVNKMGRKRGLRKLEIQILDSED